MWDLIVSVPDHCLSFYFTGLALQAYYIQQRILHEWSILAWLYNAVNLCI